MSGPARAELPDEEDDREAGTGVCWECAADRDLTQDGNEELAQESNEGALTGDVSADDHWED